MTNTPRTISDIEESTKKSRMEKTQSVKKIIKAVKFQLS